MAKKKTAVKKATKEAPSKKNGATHIVIGAPTCRVHIAKEEKPKK